MDSTVTTPPTGGNGGKKKLFGMGLAGVAAIGAILVLVVLVGSCCICASMAPPTNTPSTAAGDDQPSSPTSTPQAGQPTTAPTTKPTATPKPTKVPSAYEKYSADSMTPETIKADAQSVNWEDLIRNPDNYKGKLITLRADVVFSTEKLFNKGWYTYTCNVNPNYFSSTGLGSTGGNYVPQYIEFEYGKGLIDGDEFQAYGVYEGDTSFTDYPIIKGVYCVRYT